MNYISMITITLHCMRTIFVLMLLIAVKPVFAQRILGKVTEKATGKPVGYAVLTAPGAIAYTNAKGTFNISLARVNDTLKVNCMGYNTYQTTLVGKSISDTLRIALTERSIMLKDVNIGGKRDTRIDSARNRRLFASVYNYQGTAVKDALVDKGSLAYKPSDQISNNSNTTNISGMNLLGVIGLLTKSKNSISKLQKDMLRDEEGAYVDRKFNKDKVTALTKLTGDSLNTFMLRYRPTAELVRTMTDYDMMMYIKGSHAAFNHK